jgi:hypothetical protein
MRRAYIILDGYRRPRSAIILKTPTITIRAKKGMACDKVDPLDIKLALSFASKIDMPAINSSAITIMPTPINTRTISMKGFVIV